MFMCKKCSSKRSKVFKSILKRIPLLENNTPVRMSLVRIIIIIENIQMLMLYFCFLLHCVTCSEI
jgi:hypothetical protein